MGTNKNMDKKEEYKKLQKKITILNLAILIICIGNFFQHSNIRDNIKELRSQNKELRDIFCDIDKNIPAPGYDFKTNTFNKFNPNLVKKIQELCKSK